MLYVSVANRLPISYVRLQPQATHVGYVKMALDFTVGQQFKILKKLKVVL